MLVEYRRTGKGELYSADSEHENYNEIGLISMLSQNGGFVSCGSLDCKDNIKNSDIINACFFELKAPKDELVT